MFKSSIRLLLAAAIAVAATASLTACSTAVALDSAPDSNNPRCAAVEVRLPDSIDGNGRRETNAQSTAAWGTPARIIVRCGLPEVLASTLPCVTAGGIDWLVDSSKAPSYRFITFGRKPATEVIVDSKNASGVKALDALGFSIQQAIPSDRLCVEPSSKN
jgi:Protein of unknown function (DUF3515)